MIDILFYLMSEKTIYCNYLSRFANNIFQYCYAHLLNEHFNGVIKFSSDCTLDSGPSHDKPKNSEALVSKPVYEITDSTRNFSTKEQMGKFRPEEEAAVAAKYQFNPEPGDDLPDKDIILCGYFQHYKYYKDHKSFIRSLLYRLYQRQLEEYPSRNDLVAHYRGTDIHLQTPPEYYLHALNAEKDYDKFHIVTEDPANAAVQYLYNTINKQKPNSAFIRSTDVVDDFLFLMHAHRILMSVSTFSWMAAWLSDAEKIYFPVDNYLYNKRGDQRLIVDNEPRYTYINLFQ